MYNLFMAEKKFTARFHYNSQTMTNLVRPTIEPICRKRGFVSADIFINWSSIVGQRYALTVQPEKMVWSRKNNSNSKEPATLVVRTDSATSMFLEYEKTQFIERINSFFGWRAISRIKIVNNPVHQKQQPTRIKQPELSLTEKQKLELKVVGISNSRLKNALLRLGKDVITTAKQVNLAELR